MELLAGESYLRTWHWLSKIRMWPGPVSSQSYPILTSSHQYEIINDPAMAGRRKLLHTVWGKPEETVESIPIGFKQINCIAKWGLRYQLNPDFFVLNPWSMILIHSPCGLGIPMPSTLQWVEHRGTFFRDMFTEGRVHYVPIITLMYIYIYKWLYIYIYTYIYYTHDSLISLLW